MRLIAAFTVALLSLWVEAAAGQAQPSATAAQLPRTPWGDPDLQGTWPGGPVFMVPFERAPELGTRATLTPEELAKRNAMVVAQAAGADGAANFWPELGHTPPLTSLIVEPENGRLPALTEDGARRAKDWRIRADPEYPAPSAADLRPYDRCISRGVLGSAFPNQYSSGMQIHQAPGFVVIRHEMIHEARVITIDPSTNRRPHVSSAIRSYMGDPRGWWDGDTLVVETTNFNGKTGSYARNGDGNPTSTALRLIERFRLQDQGTLLYEVLIEDPQTFVRPWKVAFPLSRDEKYVLYEYACHEGNYAIANILSAARAAEKRRLSK